MLQIFSLKKWIITLKYYSIFSIVWPMMITELYNIKNAPLNQLRTKSKKTVDLYFLMHCSSDFRGRRCPKMHLRPENNCSKEYACEVYIFSMSRRLGWIAAFLLNRYGVHFS